MDGWELFVEKEMYNEASNLVKMQLLKFPKDLEPIPSKHSVPSPPSTLTSPQRI